MCFITTNHCYCYVAIIKPFTSLQCTSLSSFTLHYQWTEHVTVNNYNVVYHCSRTRNVVHEILTNPLTEKTFNAQPDCLYTISLEAEGYDGYLLNCYTTTPGEKQSLLLVYLIAVLVINAHYSQITKFF